jgi:hypothetical protein
MRILKQVTRVFSVDFAGICMAKPITSFSSPCTPLLPGQSKFSYLATL